MAKSKKEPQYNYVFSKLTESGSEETVLNFIAYAFYKQDKIKHIEAFKSTHGHNPDDDELASFRTLSQSDDKIQEYRDKAEAMLQNYSDSVDEAIVKEAIKGILDKNEHGFWYGVRQSLMANLIWLGLAVLFYFAVKYGWISLPNVSIQ